MTPATWVRFVTLGAVCAVFSAFGQLAVGKARGLELGGGAALDRIAYAVDGAESGHGADPRMWRPDPDGPQGPMQVSAAAAADVGGGNRFDEQQNRALGRAYLAQMCRRYGSWFDAVAAYNWGPGKMNSWIGEGRPFDKLPLAVEQYRVRVLLGAGVGFSRLRAASARLRQLAPDPHNGRAIVALLYPVIISASELATR
jgi:hypothetical protein